MDYTFNIITTSTGPSLTDVNGNSYIPSLSQTIYNNIAFGGQEKLVTQSEVELAAKQAGVYDNIVSFQEQFETIVGERGVKLSGG